MAIINHSAENKLFVMKGLIKKLFNKIGFDIIRINRRYGTDPFLDMTRFVNNDQPMIFDVGANNGQTVKKLRQYFHNCKINSFEPNPNAFEILKQNVSKMNDVHIWNNGLGSITGQITFFENSHSDMSSFLKQGETGWGVEKESIAQVTTIDQFCAEQKIDFVDILKIDTQGFELEILKGAETIISNNGIGLIYLEVIFSKMYDNLPSLGDLYNLLNKKGYKLVSIYTIHYQNNLASWSDLLFVHESYIKAAKNK